MSYKDHFIAYKDVYFLLFSWAIIGAFLPSIFAIGYAVFTFLLILRTNDFTKIFIAFLVLLLFSDSRSSIFAFAATAKIVIVVLALLYLLSNYARLAVKRNDLFRFFLPFLIFSILSTLWSTDTFTAFQKSLSYGVVFFLIPVFYLNGKHENPHFNQVMVYLFTTLLLAGLIIHQFFPLFTTLVGRYRGLLGNPNGLGIFLTLLFAISFPIIKASEGKIDRRLIWLFYGSFLASLIMSSSRTALFSVVIFFIFNRLRYFTNAFTIVVFLFFIIGYEYFLIQLPQLIGFFGLEEYFRIETLEEGSGRFVAWNFAWERIQDVFFVGGGFGHTEFVFDLYSDQLSKLGHQGNAHNSYLTIWLDTGLIGIVLFLFGLVRAIANSVAGSSYTLPIMYGVLFSTFFESWLSASLNPFTSLFLISLTSLAVANSFQENESLIQKEQALP